MIDKGNGTKPLKWKARFDTSFEGEQNFLVALLNEYGVEDVKKFLNPKKEYCYDPFLFNHMNKAVECFHEVMEMKKPKIFIKHDPDDDGTCATAILTYFIKFLNPNVEIEYGFSYAKEHGVTYKHISEYVNDYFDLIIAPDCSIEEKDYKMILKNSPNSKMLVLDHHQENLFTDKNIININCCDGQYPNNQLSGAGVVRKFCEAYCKKYNIDESILDEWIDLVGIGILGDSMDCRGNENNYYVSEAMKEKNQKNEFYNELQKRKEDEFSFGRYPFNVSWYLVPLVNGICRYGKKSEIEDLVRAVCGEQREIEYQPRRKKATDPKPPVEIHSLAWEMARVAVNVKQRQDNAVRDYMKAIEEKIEDNNLNKNSILFIDCDDIVDKKTVSGLCANKLASKYCKPVILLKSKTSTEFGGSGRNYSSSGIENLNEFLTNAGIECMG